MEGSNQQPMHPPEPRQKGRFTKLQQHNAKLATQLADANKRIVRLRFERSLLLDKLADLEKMDLQEGLSSESEGEYRECEWWKELDVAAVLARNPIGALPGAVSKGRQRKNPRKRMESMMTSEDDGGLTTEDDYPNVQSSGMLFEFEAPASHPGSSPPTKKRRSNKASAADAVLKTIPVEYDSEGHPVMPLNVGVVTIESIGEIVYDRPAYHNRRYLLPVGFHSTRSYLSTIDPNGSTLYHSRILDGGTTPLFQVTPEDSPAAVYSAPTSTGAWSAVVRAANLIRSRDYTNSASGPDYYGLSNATVAMLIEDLTNSDRCINYQRKRFERGAAHVKVTSNTNAKMKALNEAVESEPVSGVPSELDHL